MNKRDAKRQWKQNHIKALESLGFKASQFNRLRAIENKAHYDAELYANGDIDGDQYEAREQATIKAVEKLADKPIPGFFVNNDPRGYALKIDTENLEYGFSFSLATMQKDWGGYKIIAPEF